MERVIGYKQIEKQVVYLRPVRGNGKGKVEFKELKPRTKTIIVFTPIMEDLGIGMEDNNMISQSEYDQKPLYRREKK